MAPIFIVNLPLPTACKLMAKWKRKSYSRYRNSWKQWKWCWWNCKAFLATVPLVFSFLFVYSVYHTSKGEVEWLPQSILSTMLLLSDPNFCQSIDLPSFNALMYKLNINRIGTYSIVPIYLSKTKLYSKYTRIHVNQ